MVTEAPESFGRTLPKLTIVFRADASATIGTGHIHRCLGLADELAVRGHAVTFICRDEPGHLIEMVRNRGFECVALPAGIAATEDAKRTVAALSPRARLADWLIVDHYGFDTTWESAVRPCATRMMALDDLADRTHDVDVLLDAAHGTDESGLYRGLMPRSAQLLLGPSYVLLRREFFGLPQVSRTPRSVRRILVTFGGNDPLDMTGLALRAFDHPEFSSIAIDVTVGTSNPRLADVQRQAAALANVAIHVQHSKPSVLMEAADLCLGAGGTTTWERCYLGLPTLIVVLAENQREFAERVHRLGVVRSLGDGKVLAIEDLRNAIRSAIQDQAWQLASSHAGQALVDGRGIERVVRVIENVEARRGL